MKQWYTLYTKPHAEYKVAAFLQQRGFETFLPEVKTDKAKGTAPFFPRYLFVKFDFGLTSLSNIQWTPGLINILAFDDHPQPVRVEVIDLIRTKLTEIATRGKWIGHDFEPGDTVRITAGPFADMLAIFEGPTTANQRVQVLLKVLGGSRMQVEVDHLEKAAPEVDEVEIEEPMPVKRPRRTRGRGRRIHRQNQPAV